MTQLIQDSAQQRFDRIDDLRRTVDNARRDIQANIEADAARFRLAACIIELADLNSGDYTESLAGYAVNSIIIRTPSPLHSIDIEARAADLWGEIDYQAADSRDLYETQESARF